MASAASETPIRSPTPRLSRRATWVGTTGKRKKITNHYVDIVGVAGSIPAAPTIFRASPVANRRADRSGPRRQGPGAP